MTDGVATGSSRRRVIVLWNPNAGSKGGISTNSATRDELLELMDRHGLGRELVQTGSTDDLVATARRAVAQRYDAVVAAGGDGTVGAVARELLGTGVPLGILPLGSLMNIGRSLEIPRDRDEAAAIVARGVARDVDVGEARGRVFLECASIGLNAALFEQGQHMDRGHYRAALEGIRVLVRYRGAKLRLEFDDGVVSTRALMIAIANGPYTALGMTFAPEARMNDGRFDVRVFSRFSRSRILRHLAAIALGRKVHTHEVTTFRSSRVTVTGSHPVSCRADAEDLGTTPVTLVTRPGALRVLVPVGHVETLPTRQPAA